MPCTDQLQIEQCVIEKTSKIILSQIKKGGKVYRLPQRLGLITNKPNVLGGKKNKMQKPVPPPGGF